MCDSYFTGAVLFALRSDLSADLRYDQACEMKLREIDERLKALQEVTAALDRCDNKLLAEKKHLSELKGKRRQLEQKISTKEDRSASPNSLKGLFAVMLYHRISSFLWLVQKHMNCSAFLYVSTPLSLRQMEQNVTDLKKIEEATKEKVSRVNSQKVAVVKALVDSIKVNKLWFMRRLSWSSSRSS